MKEAPQSLRFSNMLGMVGVSVGYGLLLSKTSLGRRLNNEKPTTIVILGVILTLLWLAFEDPKAAGKAFLYFMLSIIPGLVQVLHEFYEFEDDDGEEEAEWAD